MHEIERAKLFKNNRKLQFKKKRLIF